MKRIFYTCLISLFLLSLMTSPGLSQEASGILKKNGRYPGRKKSPREYRRHDFLWRLRADTDGHDRVNDHV